MFKKLDFKRLNYGELDRYDSHDLKRDQLKSFYQTFDFLDLIKKWPDIVSPKFAAVSSPLKIRQDTLFIITKHPSISEALSFVAEELKEKIFKVLPELRPIIKKVAYQTQEGYFNQKEEIQKTSAQAPQIHPQDPRVKLLKQEADRLFGDIADEELRTVMISIFMQSKF